MNKFDYIIRQETTKDYHEVENLAREAFWNLSVPGCHEHYFIHVMRNHQDFVPELDFVIEINSEIIASIMYTKAVLIDENNTKKTYFNYGSYLCSSGLSAKRVRKAFT